VYIEGLTGDIFAESEDAQLYHDVFDNLRATALSPALSQQKIQDVREASARSKEDV
jgi:hypothetical protein